MTSIVDKENVGQSQLHGRVSGKASLAKDTKKRALKDIVVPQNETEGSKRSGKKLNFEIPDYIKNFDFKKRRKVKKGEDCAKKEKKWAKRATARKQEYWSMGKKILRNSFLSPSNKRKALIVWTKKDPIAKRRPCEFLQLQRSSKHNIIWWQNANGNFAQYSRNC